MFDYILINVFLPKNPFLISIINKVHISIDFVTADKNYNFIKTKRYQIIIYLFFLKNSTPIIFKKNINIEKYDSYVKKISF